MQQKPERPVLLPPENTAKTRIIRSGLPYTVIDDITIL